MLSVSHARALRSVLSVAAFLTTLFSDAAAATPERIREEYARVQDTLARGPDGRPRRSEEHTSELQSRVDLVCRLLLEKKKKNYRILLLALGQFILKTGARKSVRLRKIRQ